MAGISQRTLVTTVSILVTALMTVAWSIYSWGVSVDRVGRSNAADIGQLTKTVEDWGEQFEKIIRSDERIKALERRVERLEAVD